MTKIRNGQIWRHKKTGGEYEIVATDAGVQCSAAPVVEELFADDEWVVYRSTRGHRMLVRPRPEFLDGRFELVKDAD